MNEDMIIRAETPADYIGITRVNDLAFGRPNEGKLVLALRKLEPFDARLSLVAEKGHDIIGHVLLFPITIQGEEEAYPALSLGPIAVLPEHQSQGIGGKLIREAHQCAQELGYTAIILVGHPGYYPRFGYRLAADWGLTNPWGIQGDPFMAIELVESSLDGKAGLCLYPEPFSQAT